MILSTARAYKRCTENGTWWQVENTLQEWTDYTACVRIEVRGGLGCHLLYSATTITVFTQVSQMIDGSNLKNFKKMNASLTGQLIITLVHLHWRKEIRCSYKTRHVK